MIERSDVCAAAQRISDFVAIRGDDVTLEPLFESVGLTEPVLVHMVEHLCALGCTIDPGSLTMGALIALLAVDHDGQNVEITDDDLTELLSPLP
jgi:hypothetical protein